MSEYKRCPKCDKRVMPWHKFCSNCGNNLKFNTELSLRYINNQKKLKINHKDNKRRR